jgi:hypothetical protein
MKKILLSLTAVTIFAATGFGQVVLLSDFSSAAAFSTSWSIENGTGAPFGGPNNGTPVGTVQVTSGDFTGNMTRVQAFDLQGATTASFTIIGRNDGFGGAFFNPNLTGSGIVVGLLDGSSNAIASFTFDTSAVDPFIGIGTGGVFNAPIVFQAGFDNTDLANVAQFTIGLDGIPGSSIAHYGFNNLTVTLIPEPSTYALLLIGGAGLLALRRRQAKA